MTKPTRRKIGWGIVAAVANILGILTDVPTLIKDHVNDVPEWLTNPNFLWFLAITIIYGVILVVLWRRDRKKVSQFVWIRAAVDRAETIGNHFGKLHRKHKKWRKKDENGVFVFTDDAAANRFITEYKTDVPRFLQRTLGAREREAYVNAIETATGDDPREVALQIEIAIAKWVLSLINREIRTILKRASEHVTVMFEPSAESGDQPETGQLATD
ncbi:MAG: hypothetical protein IH988_01935 [Planctomycetes bacterium]|nr:hypothetical protein [Planctomycetota bacterium]